jgi:hypothetical protein
MRRFFRFSVRDLFWLTLVVATALAWFVRERQHQNEVGQLQAEAMEAGKWRLAFGGLESLLSLGGRRVVVDFESCGVKMVGPRPARDDTITARFAEPTILQQE